MGEIWGDVEEMGDRGGTGKVGEWGGLEVQGDMGGGGVGVYGVYGG